MQTYRIYWLDDKGRIRRGEWIEAEDDDHARRLAEGLCDEGTPTIEVWQGARPVDEVDCHATS